MPNWCQNVTTLSHTDPEMIKRVEAAINRGELLSEFVPIPQELHIVAGSVSDPAEQVALKTKQEANFANLGYKDWYDFCCGEWGTKWDVDAGVINSTDNAIDISFDTAWSPPIAWYEKMTALGFEVDAYYYESGMGYCGHWFDGYDDYHDVGSNSEETKNSIPSDIDDMFSISEGQYEWEQEDREDLTAWIEDAIEEQKQPAIVHTPGVA